MTSLSVFEENYFLFQLGIESEVLNYEIGSIQTEIHSKAACWFYKLSKEGIFCAQQIRFIETNDR